MIGEKVFVYWDLHRKCFSVKSLKTGRVLNYDAERKKIPIQMIILSSCKFRVGQKGRQKVIETGHKNIHAGVVGTVVSVGQSDSLDGLLQVRYNPRLFNTFVWVHNHRPVYKADKVVLEYGAVWAS
jgi:hypothetical protein